MKGSGRFVEVIAALPARAGRLAAVMAVLAVLATAGPAGAIERFPPPDFTEHALPPTTTPAPQATWYEYLDVAVLVLMLVLATYLALVRRSRRALVGLSVAAVAYFGFYRVGCVCAIGSVQNVALALADPGYAVPLFVLAFFLLPMVFTLLFGRTFCAAVCPHGALQDLVHLKTVRLPRSVNAALGLVAYLYLGLAVMLAMTGGPFIICQYDPFIGIFRFDGPAGVLLFGGALLVVGLFIARPYCRFLCPLGALFRLVSPFARRHVKIYPDRCINCRLCEDSCPVQAIEPSSAPPAEPPDPRAGRRVVAVMLLLTVLLTVGGAMAMRAGSPALARFHRKVRLAERIYLESTGAIEPVDDDSELADAAEAFRAQGGNPEDLYAQARAIQERFRAAATWLGAYVGLVLGVKLVQVSGRRRRSVYEVDRSGCVACGRCFEYCPRDPSCRVQVEGFWAAEQLADVARPVGGVSSGGPAPADRPGR